MSEPICPACWHDMCKDCIGSGCYCDCQIDAWPTVASDYEPADALIEDEDDRTMRESGYC